MTLHQYPARHNSTSPSTAQLRKLELAFILLWVFLLAAWSTVLIGLVFTFRVNKHHCEMCRRTTLCRSVLLV